jgi:hypothetical protein
MKAGVTRIWRKEDGNPATPVFQPGFYEHVIRHEKALERVREYIVNNPLQWELDRENPARSGESEFYRWMEAYGAKLETGI